MAQVLYGNDEVFNALAFGQAHPSTQQFLAMEQHVPTHLFTHQNNEFLERTHQLIDSVVNSNAMRYAAAARRSIGALWQDDSIRHLHSIGDFQQAPLSMQRWLMAEPTVHRKYRYQRIEGYGELYTEPFPEDGIGEENLDYRHVMNGVVVVNQEASINEPDWIATTYFDDRCDVIPLDFLDQCDIIDSWANLRHWLRKGEKDPTSRFNASL